MMTPERIDEIYEKAWQGEIGVRPALILAVEEVLEEAVQLCLAERDKADTRYPDTSGSTMNMDHLMGQGWMANLLAKKLRALKPQRAADAERGEG
jgi:hypothetical protein